MHEKIFEGFCISSFILNKKLKVALTYNLKPEEENSFEYAMVSPLSKNSTTYNDTFAEWDTIETVNSIKSALELFHNVIMIEANEDAYEKFKKERPDIVFNFAECAYGISREGQIPAMLDMLRIPYTGSDPLTMMTCLDKARTKEILSYYGVPTAKFITAENLADIENHNLEYPLFIKPVGEGSGKGIFNNSFIQNKTELQQRLQQCLQTYNQPCIIEEYLPGREFTVAILGNDSETEVLPIIEINFSQLPSGILPVYSFEAKWIYDTRQNPLDIFTCPANIESSLQEKIKGIALKTYKILRCKDWSRIDIRLDSKGEPNIIEVNPLPGVLPDPSDNSCFPKAARAAGLSYEEMINKVLIAAAKRHKLI
ncbi:ATP-grasp domain-containing protein [Melioribacteraceae bacterium 4301-Me]|uniref:D-alanine--D-alanine ligase family protein n=1 Tax=Pyranulibacter aquaticus TaxID=3163344 RepID=UPI0035998A96